MTDADIRLAALLAADDAPDQDRVFEVQVMAKVTARVEERRTVMTWVQVVAYAIAGLVLAATALPPLVASFSGLVQLPPGTGPVAFSSLVVIGCMAAAWRYLKPIADWRVLMSWADVPY